MGEELHTYTIIIRVKVIKIAAANPPANRPLPIAGDTSADDCDALAVSSQSVVQAFVTVSRVPPTTMKNGVCPTILSAMIDAVSDPVSVEYSKMAE